MTLLVNKVDETVNVTDPIAILASKQHEWRHLPIPEKVVIIQEIISILQNMTMEDDVIPLLGIPEMQMIGFNVDAATGDTAVSAKTDEAQYEAAMTSMLYTVIVCQAMKQLLEVYQYHAVDHCDDTTGSSSSSSAAKSKKRSTTVTPQIVHVQPKRFNDDSTNKRQAAQLVVVTAPITMEEQLTPFGKSKIELYLNPNATKYEPLTLLFSPDANHVNSTTITKDSGCMVVLGAGNQSFLSIMDCIYGLFHCHSTVMLKYHPIRSYHDIIVRKIFDPLIERGYFTTECTFDVWTDIQRAQEMVHHPMVSHVHMTGSKATHDTIVWGSPSIPVSERMVPTLRAHMTSELGCITPWIIAPTTNNKLWTKNELQHQAQHLFASLYSNAGANCNSPKVVLLPSKWIQKDEFIQLLQNEMKRHPLPISYYPGSVQRYEMFRTVYPNDHVTIGMNTKLEQERRCIVDSATILPWLLVTLPTVVDLRTEAGRDATRNEFAFQHEPFCPVLTIAQYNHMNPNETNDDDLMTGVTIANEYIYGTLSCTLVTNDDAKSIMNHENAKLEEAIRQLRYGDVAINCWSALLYAAPGSATWGAYPGESLNNVVSGIGQVQNHSFVSNVEKSILRSPIVDTGLHLKRPTNKSYRQSRLEAIAIGNLSLRPSVYNIMNLIFVTTIGYPIPKLMISTPFARTAVVMIATAVLIGIYRFVTATQQ